MNPFQTKAGNPSKSLAAITLGLVIGSQFLALMFIPTMFARIWFSMCDLLVLNCAVVSVWISSHDTYETTAKWKKMFAFIVIVSTILLCTLPIAAAL
jgi:hypothetical protein